MDIIVHTGISGIEKRKEKVIFRSHSPVLHD